MMYTVEALLCRLPIRIRTLLEFTLPTYFDTTAYLRCRLAVLRAGVSDELLERMSKVSGRYASRFMALKAMVLFNRGEFKKAAAAALAAGSNEQSAKYRREFLVSSALYELEGGDASTAFHILSDASAQFDRRAKCQQRATWHFLNYFAWESLYRLNELERGVPFLEEAARTDTSDRDGRRFELGQAYYWTGRYVKARECFMQAQSNPEYRDLATQWLSTVEAAENAS